MRFSLTQMVQFIADSKYPFPMNSTVKYVNYTTDVLENKIQNVANLVAWEESRI